MILNHFNKSDLHISNIEHVTNVLRVVEWKSVRGVFSETRKNRKIMKWNSFYDISWYIDLVCLRHDNLLSSTCKSRVYLDNWSLESFYRALVIHFVGVTKFCATAEIPLKRQSPQKCVFTTVTVLLEKRCLITFFTSYNTFFLIL